MILKGVMISDVRYLCGIELLVHLRR